VRTESSKRRLLAGLGLAALAAPVASAGQDDPATVARGAALYAANCAACHGAALEGQPDWQTQKADGSYPAPPHDASGHTWHHGDRLLRDYIRRGGAAALGEIKGFTSGMPGFGETLSEAEIDDVLAFIRSHWPARERAYQRQATEAGG